MSKYGICYIGSIDRGNATKTHAVVRYSDGMFFRGYDFMGSANWAEKYSLEEAMTEDEAKQIVSDLEAADEDDEKPTALEIVLQAAQERLDSLNAHGCVDKDLEDAIRTLAATIGY